jgi:hypothetical protein
MLGRHRSIPVSPASECPTGPDHRNSNILGSGDGRTGEIRKRQVDGDAPVVALGRRIACGCSSMVEQKLPKLKICTDFCSFGCKKRKKPLLEFQ